MEEKQDVIRIGEQDEIMDIIEKIMSVPGKTVTLVVPKGAAILQDVTNLKMLQKKTEQLGKEISISKSESTQEYQTNTVAAPHALHARVPMARHEPQTASRISDIKPKSKRVSDMVMRGETVDLRQISAEKNHSQEQTHDDNFYVSETANHSAFSPAMAVAAESATAQPENQDNEPVQPRGNNYFSRLKEDEQEMPNIFKEDLVVRPENVKDEEETKNVRRIKREDLFDDNIRTEPESGNSGKFDFSYGQANKKKKKKRSPVLSTLSSRFFAIFIIVCLCGAGVSLFFLLPKAEIAIALKKENVKGDFTFMLDKTISEADADSNKLPVEENQISSEKTQSFPATSKKQLTTKATGDLTIMNECSTGDQTLVAGTRFLSKDGSKIFKLETSVTVPGFTKPEDAVVPGTKTVKVTAEEAGESYNIGATSFTIPKLQELSSWKYSCLYARSSAAMAGGSNKEVNYVSQDDYDKAKETLTNLVKQENATKISQQKSDEFVYVDNDNSEGEISVKSPVKVNDVADQFEMTVSIKKSVLTVNKKDLEAVLAQKIKEQNNSQTAQLVDNSLSYEIGDITDKDKDISMNVTASEDFIFKPDQTEVKKAIIGMNKPQLNEYFGKMRGVESVRVNFWPQWVNKVPDSLDKINISLDIKDSV